MGHTLPVNRLYLKSRQARLINFTGEYKPDQLNIDSLPVDLKDSEPELNLIKKIGRFLLIPYIALSISASLLLASIAGLHLF